MSLDYPHIQRMASGNLSLAISDAVTWESFPQAAREFLKSIGGHTLFRFDTAADRNWLVMVKWRPFFLAQDELGMSLDSMAKFGNRVIVDIQAQVSGGHDA